jgi:hypothetical protein
MQTVVAVTARVVVEHPDTLLPTIAREMSYCKKKNQKELLKLLMQKFKMFKFVRKEIIC